jgi:hypothetical protein
MARNDIPDSAQQLSQLAAAMHTGLIKTGASVPVTYITATKLQGDLAAFNTAEEAFGAARRALKDAYAIFIPAAAALLEWLNAVRPILISHFGYFWTADWAAAGFVSMTTAIPSSIEDRLGLARSLIAFLTAHPDFEVAITKVTAADGTTVRDAALNAQGAVSDAEQALKDAAIARQPTREQLVADMRGLIRNLASALAKDDPRWLAFGLQMPASKTTPGKPAGLQAQMDVASGGILLTCDALPLAQRFRWRGRVAGSGLPFELIARSTLPLAKTAPMPAGTTLEIMVQAVNGGSQSVPSDSIIFTVPTAAAPAEPAATRPAEITAPVNGNGSNGHANGSRIPAVA